jgi:hypothetical protein
MSCDCNTLVIGEAGPQGPQGLGGINGSNGTNGVNSFTSLTAAFTQPTIAPAAGSSSVISVSNTDWMALGQTLYIAQAGYYRVLAINSSTSISVSLTAPDVVPPGQTVTSGRAVSPAGTPSSFEDQTVGSLDINTAFIAVNPALRVSGSNTLPLLQVDATLNQVGINVSPIAGGKTFTVGGSVEITGDTLISSGVVQAPRFRTGTTATSGELTKILFSNQSTTVTLANTVGAVTRATLTVTGAALGDMVQVGYGANPGSTFEADVSISAMVTATDTVTVFLTNFSTAAYTSVPINLNLAITTFVLVV